MGDMFYGLAFMMFAGITVGSALCVLFFDNLLHAAVALFFSLAGVAGLYILIGADFLGVVQLLVYAGGILVLLIFGIFLTSRMQEAHIEFKEHRISWLTGLGISAALFFAISSVIASKSSKSLGQTIQKLNHKQYDAPTS